MRKFHVLEDKGLRWFKDIMFAFISTAGIFLVLCCFIETAIALIVTLAAERIAGIKQPEGK